MELDGKYRHELKYKIHFSEYLAIRQRLRSVMRPDPHAGADGTYQIRSIYFDNVYDKALRERLTGSRNVRNFVFVIIMTGFLLLRWKRRSSTTASV